MKRAGSGCYEHSLLQEALVSMRPAPVAPVPEEPVNVFRHGDRYVIALT